MLQARIDSLKDSLSRAMIVDKSTLPTASSSSAPRSRSSDLDHERGRDLPPRRPPARRITTPTRSYQQPDRSGAFGQKIGEIVSYSVPMGTIRYEVLEIRFWE